MSAPPPASTPRLDLLRFLERVQERDLQRTRDWIATEEQLISAQGELKQWHGLATRYDKTATIYLAGLHLAAIAIWSAR
ncbi:hypothetical protein ACFZBM_37770 [Streptomyces lavendulae]|uniref:hypothetical protein n=1 Tax=Streptomyces lavendulae TaxID=1914 RepID=UPI0036F0F8A6